jgi:hypothetical protein
MPLSTPAAGASGGPAPRLAALDLPEFMYLEGNELVTLLHVLRDPYSVHLYLLLLVQMRFTEGVFLGTYARLMDLMTPPKPERGRRLAGPTMWQIRRALADLVQCGLVRRGLGNEAQGELRLILSPRKNPAKTKKVSARPAN